MRVLLIDDEILAIRGLKSLLAHFPGIEIVGFANQPEEAVRKIINLKPDLVFIDIEIGQSTGFEIIKEAGQSGVHPKYIVVTAFSQYAIAGIRSGVCDYLLKPVDIRDLRAALERITDLSILNVGLGAGQVNQDLTLRENEVLNGMLAGLTSREIANELTISINTVNTFRRRILKKMGVRDTVGLMINSAFKPT
jgi:two-component system LytT family response regulator